VHFEETAWLWQPRSMGCEHVDLTSSVLEPCMLAMVQGTTEVCIRNVESCLQIERGRVDVGGAAVDACLAQVSWAATLISHIWDHGVSILGAHDSYHGPSIGTQRPCICYMLQDFLGMPKNAIWCLKQEPQNDHTRVATLEPAMERWIFKQGDIGAIIGFLPVRWDMPD